MHKLRTAVLALLLFSVPAAVRAQSALVNLPRASQHAVLTQRIGITDITINYSRPLVNGRKVWGGLVPYGQPWRSGANENTTISFGDPVTIEGQPLAAGTYGLHMIPAENEWIIAFSKMNAAWGSFSYDQAEDALRVTVKPAATDFHDALTYDFDDLKPDSAVVTLRWEKVAVPFKVGVNVHEVVETSLHNQLRGRVQYEWQAWDDSANYLLAEKTDFDDALKYANQSILIEQRYDNLMTKSQVLDALDATMKRPRPGIRRSTERAWTSSTVTRCSCRKRESKTRRFKSTEIWRRNSPITGARTPRWRASTAAKATTPAR